MKNIICSIMALGFLCGCSMINPYQSEFSCPDTFKGKCASVREVYMEDSSGKPQEKAESNAIKPKPRCTTIYSEMEGGGLVTTCNEEPSPDTVNSPASAPPLSNPVAGNAEETSFNQYRSSLYDRFSGLLKEPQTPIVAPPKVMRVLLMPYTGQENEFYMLRYVYFFVDKPRWILGDSIVADGEEE